MFQAPEGVRQYTEQSRVDIVGHACGTLAVAYFLQKPGDAAPDRVLRVVPGGDQQLEDAQRYAMAANELADRGAQTQNFLEQPVRLDDNLIGTLSYYLPCETTGDPSKDYYDAGYAAATLHCAGTEAHDIHQLLPHANLLDPARLVLDFLKDLKDQGRTLQIGQKRFDMSLVGRLDDGIAKAQQHEQQLNQIEHLTTLHTDITLGNMRWGEEGGSNAHGRLIDLDTLCVGHSAFDLARFLGNEQSQWRRMGFEPGYQDALLSGYEAADGMLPAQEDAEADMEIAEVRYSILMLAQQIRKVGLVEPKGIPWTILETNRRIGSLGEASEWTSLAHARTSPDYPTQPAPITTPRMDSI